MPERAKIATERACRVSAPETMSSLDGPELSWISCRKRRSGVLR